MYKVCHLTTVHPPDDIRIFVKECSSLARKGYDVTLISANVNSNDIQNGVKRVFTGVKCHTRIGRMSYSMWQVYRQALKVNADLYQFHDPELIIVGLMLRLQGKKVIYDVHEDLPRQIFTKHWIPTFFLKKLLAFLVELLERSASRFFTAIVCATPFITQRFKKYNNNTLTIANFACIEAHSFPICEWSKKEPFVIYQGGITFERGLMEMVQAIGRTNLNLYLAGSFYPTSLEQQIQKLPGWERVSYQGVIDRPRVHQLMQQSRAGLVLLHPKENYINALPIKIFEYMSAGIPIIASNFPLWKEIIENNKCGICVDPLNINEIVTAINWLNDHPVEAEKMGRNGRQVAEEKFNWKSQEQELITLYDRLLKKNECI